jgi:hypothetical protein
MELHPPTAQGLEEALGACISAAAQLWIHLQRDGSEAEQRHTERTCGRTTEPRIVPGEGDRVMENRTGKCWTAEELEAVRTAYIANTPVEQIAKEQRRSYMAIVSRLQRLGLMDQLGNRKEVTV